VMKVLAVLAVALGACVACGDTARAEEPAPVTARTMKTVLDEGVHPHMRWSRFTDHRIAVRRFYEAIGFDLIWTHRPGARGDPHAFPRGRPGPQCA
jgi:hypothetical protein